MDPTKIPDYDEVKQIVEQLAAQYFSDDEKLRTCAMDHPVTWLVASAPYFAGSRHPMRWAAANLGTLMNARNNKEFFLADPGDTLETRLQSILQTENGKATPAFRRISLLLQLILLQSYKWDQDEDARANRFNALNAGRINYGSEASRLRGEIHGYGSMDAVDSIITVDEITVETQALATCSFWYCA